MTLGQAERQRELDTPRSRDVFIKEELLLQLEQLRARVGRARALVLLGLRRVPTCVTTLGVIYNKSKNLVFAFVIIISSIIIYITI